MKTMKISVREKSLKKECRIDVLLRDLNLSDLFRLRDSLEMINRLIPSEVTSKVLFFVRDRIKTLCEEIGVVYDK